MSAVEKDIPSISSNQAETPFSSNSIIIALDAMGGDAAPDIVIKGAALAAKELGNLNFRIYGRKNQVLSLIEAQPDLNGRYTFIHAEEAIANDEKPSNALRKGRSSSMYMAINSVKMGEAKAIVSSGNTGALMAFAKYLMQTLPGIDRPAIGGILPNEKGYSVMLDLGANVHCDGENLFEFAIMGNAFCRAIFNIEKPSIGLLNVGAEKNKGNEAVKAALDLLKESELDLNIYGYIEGDDIGLGTTDVIVADGFSGNIALKTAEGISKLFTKTLKKELSRNPLGWIAGLLAIPAFKRVKKKMDPRNYNGAMLLGLNGIVIKSHGSTDDIGFANAIRVAYKLVKNNINENIIREITSSGYMTEEDELEKNLQESMNG